MISDEKYVNAPIQIEHELKFFFNLNSRIIIFDIGSCDGLDSIKYSLLFPLSKIYAFEPIEKNVDLIHNNIKKYKIGNIITVPYALSDLNGKSDFYISSGKPKDFDRDYEWNKSSSLLLPYKVKDIYPWLKFDDRIEVITITLNDFCKNYSINCIDFIHMDVQGAELLVLKGAKKYINKIKLIWLEVENIEFYKNQPLKDEIESFLISNGFIKLKDTVNSIDGDQLWVQYGLFLKARYTQALKNIYSKLVSLITFGRE